MSTIRMSLAGPVVKEYDPETADMKEVNNFIDEMEKKHAGRAFDLDSGEPVTTATPENKDIAIVGPLAGG
jgi:hypothetical protein